MLTIDQQEKKAHSYINLLLTNGHHSNRKWNSKAKEIQKFIFFFLQQG